MLVQKIIIQTPSLRAIVNKALKRQYSYLLWDPHNVAIVHCNFKALVLWGCVQHSKISTSTLEVETRTPPDSMGVIKVVSLITSTTGKTRMNAR